MLGVRIPKDLEDRLNRLSKATNRSKSYYVIDAIREYLDEHEEILIRIAEYEDQLRKGTSKTISLDEMMKKHGLEES